MRPAARDRLPAEFARVDALRRSSSLPLSSRARSSRSSTSCIMRSVSCAMLARNSSEARASTPDCSVSIMIFIAVSGVRNSCETFETKSRRSDSSSRMRVRSVTIAMAARSPARSRNTRVVTRKRRSWAAEERDLDGLLRSLAQCCREPAVELVAADDLDERPARVRGAVTSKISRAASLKARMRLSSPMRMTPTGRARSTSSIAFCVSGGCGAGEAGPGRPAVTAAAALVYASTAATIAVRAKKAIRQGGGSSAATNAHATRPSATPAKSSRATTSWLTGAASRGTSTHGSGS